MITGDTYLAWRKAILDEGPPLGIRYVMENAMYTAAHEAFLAGGGQEKIPDPEHPGQFIIIWDEGAIRGSLQKQVMVTIALLLGTDERPDRSLMSLLLSFLTSNAEVTVAANIAVAVAPDTHLGTTTEAGVGGIH
jgi:hypothetical protein